MDRAASDVLPRHFQADLDRLYKRVILPGLGEMPVDDLPPDRFPANTLDGFLDRAAHETSYLLSTEVRRGYALMVAALFERQLAKWTEARPDAQGRAWRFRNMLKQAGETVVDLESKNLGKRLELLHTLANVIRHGDGPSLEGLKRDFPGLWSGSRANAAGLKRTEDIVLDDAVLSDLMQAVTRFWGLADRRPGAVVDAPY